MGRPGPRQFVAPAALPGAALQPASFSIEDLEEHQGGAIVFKMNYEGTYRPADPGDFAPAPGHEDLARSDDRDLRSGCRGATVGVLQPELQGPARRHLEGEGGRKADPRSWRHGGVKHKLARGALRVDSRGDDAHHCDSPASTATLSVLLGALPWGLRRGRARAAETQAAAARTTATPPARRLRPGDKGLAASSAGGGQDPLWGPFPSPQLKTGGSVPLVQEEARMRKKKRRSNGKG